MRNGSGYCWIWCSAFCFHWPTTKTAGATPSAAIRTSVSRQLRRDAKELFHAKYNLGKEQRRGAVRDRVPVMERHELDVWERRRDWAAQRTVGRERLRHRHLWRGWWRLGVDP